MRHVLFPVAAAGTIGVLAFEVLSLRAQSQVVQPLTFEVASVKRHPPGDVSQNIATTPDGSYRLSNGTARMLIRQAYRFQDHQIIGAPPWTDVDRFDVVARAPSSSTAAALPDMLKSLLRERFGLSAHSEIRDMPVFALSVGRRDGVLGPSLRRTPTEASAECAAQRTSRGAPGRSDRRPCGIGISGGNIRAGDATLGQLLGLLSPLLGRTTVDKTGLSGTFDYELNWTPDQMRDFKGSADLPPGTLPRINGVPFDPNGPSLFTAVQEQLGLKLEPTKGPVDVLVIDHVEHPSED